jgi:hypothetical protein
MFNWRVKLKQKKIIKGKTYQKNEGHIRKKKNINFYWMMKLKINKTLTKKNRNKKGLEWKI